MSRHFRAIATKQVAQRTSARILSPGLCKRLCLGCGDFDFGYEF
jgi:hypothetical protein